MSDVGTFMQGVGAAWLMVSLGAGPLYVALTQTAATLPFFLLALPAGSIGDIVDRRKLILYTEAWMVCVAAVLAVGSLLATGPAFAPPGAPLNPSNKTVVTGTSGNPARVL
jgi:MFS family permease